jgi:hypothetical protein
MNCVSPRLSRNMEQSAQRNEGPTVNGRVALLANKKVCEDPALRPTDL